MRDADTASFFASDLLFGATSSAPMSYPAEVLAKEEAIGEGSMVGVIFLLRV